MSPLIRLFSYLMRYKNRFIAGVIISFFVALLNGLSLTAFIPLFEALGNNKDFFEIQFTKSERVILTKSLEWLQENRDTALEDEITVIPAVPRAPESIDRNQALKILNLTFKNKKYGLTNVEYFRLRTLIRWKLRINSGAHAPIKIVFIACMVALPLYFLKLILLLISVRLIAGIGYRSVRDIRHDLYANVQRLPLTYYYREKTGVIMSRIINDAEIVAAVISSNLRDGITNVFYILTHLLLLAYLNLPLLIISALLVPLVLSPVTLFSKKIARATKRGQEHLADLNAHVLETIAGMRVIRSFGREDFEKGKFERVNQKFFKRMFKQQFYVRVAPNLVELFSVLVAVVIIALGASFVDPADFTGGEFIAFLIILMFILRPVVQLSGFYSKLIQGKVAAERIFEIMDKEQDVEEPKKPVNIGPLRNAIEFNNIRFAYPGTENNVLEKIQLMVPVGKTVALVGESGGGKSTLMDLLARFFDPTGGAILIDGVDIRKFRTVDHRSRIGIVTQDIFLFHGSIQENIAYGDIKFNRREVEKAARLAHAHDFISQIPGAYDALIGERGFTLSGGQRQRIAIARALLRDPEILILDEATSALDTESERLVQHALERLFKNRTTFVIAHRLSTIEKADMIVVISEGRLVDQGTHQELMERGGLYARLQKISRQSIPGQESRA